MKYFFIFIICLTVTKPVLNRTHKLTTEQKQKLERAIEVNNLNKFYNKIGYFESSNNYDTTNTKHTYFGRYQFGRAALKDVGVVSIKKFLSTPQLQDSAMLSYMKINYQRLKPLINKFVGDTLNGVKITVSGILAGAHLVGANNVKKYLISNGTYIKKDGNGTALTKYMIALSDFKIKHLME